MRLYVDIEDREDIKEICVQSVLVEVDLGGLVSDERHYTEVLKRFKNLKK